MKQTHLKTLSARVKELHELFVFGKIDLEQFFHLTLDANKQSETIVTLAQFVPCDKNGVPLRNPKNRVVLSWCDKAQDDQIAADKKEYNEAQKSVIFEGWEVVKTIAPNVVRLRNKSLGLCLDFTGHNEIILVGYQTKSNFSYPTYIESLADLAAATTENPLKLK